MANLCADCQNWRKCSWTKDFDHRIPVESSDLKTIVKKNQEFYHITKCPQFLKDKPRKNVSGLSASEDEKFCQDPLKYLDNYGKVPKKGNK